MKNFLRGFARFLVGAVIIVELLLFMGLGAVRFRILNPSFWVNSFASSDTFTSIAIQLQQATLAQTDPEQAVVPESELDQEAIKQSANQIQTLVETNFERILEFLVDTDPSASLLLYVPVEVLGIPPEALTGTPLEGLGEETELGLFLSIFGQTEEQIEDINTKLDTVRQAITFFPVVWGGLLVLLLLALVVFFFLGAGKLWRVRGTGVVLTISGLLAVIIAIGVKQLVIYGLASQPEGTVPPLAVNLVPELIEGFFSFGRNIGIGVAIAGVLVIGYTVYQVKNNTLKPEVKPTSSKKKS